MLGITLKIDETDQYLVLNIAPDLVEEKVEVAVILELVHKSIFKHFFIFDENIIDAVNSYKTMTADNMSTVIEHQIGERRDTEISFRIAEDQLSAYLTTTVGYAGKVPSVKSLQEELNSANIKRGVSQKGLTRLVQQTSQAFPGEIFEELIAKGLAPKDGKPSRLKPLVQNALDRILKPQTVGSTRVDMRNLGAIICVQKGAELLRRMPPTEGRNGFTIGGDIIVAKKGEWVKFKPGDGTVISDDDENLLLADIFGMPKFIDQSMWVDNIYSCKGVNVGSGNVNYDGSVLVNGDVTEKMEIHATGDVTINGFVESAIIHAGGDIIITEGAMGKVNESSTEYSTSLTAKGNIHVQHGQGLDINCNGNVTVGRQLAYSRINCRGKVIIGAVDNPNGNIFACMVKCRNSITAGTLGAVSGSNLTIDYSEDFNTLLERKDTLDELLKKVTQNNVRHLERINLINSQFIPQDMKGRVDEANQLFKSEKLLVGNLENKSNDMHKAKVQYQTDIQVIANKRLYPGVVVKLNNRTWRADREYDKAKIRFFEHQWQVE
jgi:uncharacterized protein (DUF342 family)